MKERFVPGFLPSTHGFRFANRWPSTPALWLGAGYLHLGIGDAAAGLCGGMCFVVRDQFEAGLPVPDPDAPPAAGTTLFSEIVSRQVDSLDRLVGLPIRFWALSVLHPERRSAASRLLNLAPRSVISARDEWPRLRAAIDAGQLPMVGLLRSGDRNPFRLVQNHQVMAWGYRVDREALDLRIYDPNWPGRDDVELRVRLGVDPDGASPTVTLAQSTGEPLLGFFAAPYGPPRHDGRGA